MHTGIGMCIYTYHQTFCKCKISRLGVCMCRRCISNWSSPSPTSAEESLLSALVQAACKAAN